MHATSLEREIFEHWRIACVREGSGKVYVSARKEVAEGLKGVPSNKEPSCSHGEVNIRES